jgi:ABC-type polysaccharide/polyol phosphate transport system ATPase subunit
MKKAEIDRKLDEIIDFAEIEPFISDQRYLESRWRLAMSSCSPPAATASRCWRRSR